MDVDDFLNRAVQRTPSLRSHLLAIGSVVLSALLLPFIPSAFHYMASLAPVVSAWISR
jgi:hypothetical protein